MIGELQVWCLGLVLSGGALPGTWFVLRERKRDWQPNALIASQEALPLPARDGKRILDNWVLQSGTNLRRLDFRFYHSFNCQHGVSVAKRGKLPDLCRLIGIRVHAMQWAHHMYINRDLLGDESAMRTIRRDLDASARASMVENINGEFEIDPDIGEQILGPFRMTEIGATPDPDGNLMCMMRHYSFTMRRGAV